MRSGAVLLGMCTPYLSGMTVLDKLSSTMATQPVIVLAIDGTVELYRRAFKAGAAEFLQHPISDAVANAESEAVALCDATGAGLGIVFEIGNRIAEESGLKSR